MQTILASKTVSMTELRDPAKVFAYAGNSPVAVMNRNRIVGYFVPNAVVDKVDCTYADSMELQSIVDQSIQENQAILEYLKNK